MTKYAKIACIADNTSKAQETYKSLSIKYHFTEIEHDNLNDIDALIAIGGDGFMLKAAHRFMNSDKPIFGLNAGNIGFLMNNLHNSEADLYNRINQAKLYEIFPLEVSAITISGKQHKSLAINEVYLIRDTNQAAKIRIIIDDQECLPEMVGDGIIVATPAGSTAYNFSAGGPILPYDSNLLSLKPISVFRPRRWSGALIPNSKIIQFDILHPDKRFVKLVADLYEVLEVIKVEVKKQNQHKIQFLFDSNDDLEMRIIHEQFAY